MVTRLRAVVALVGWALLLAGSLLFLHRLPASSFAPSDGSAYVIAALRYGALALAWYLAASTLIALTAHLCRVPSWATFAARVTVAPIHRLTRAAAGAIVAASTLVPAAAAAGAQQPLPQPVMTWVEDGEDDPSTADSAPTSAPAPAPLPEIASPARSIDQVEVVVAPGDHLWSLATRRLAELLGREPSDREVSPYWARVVRANADGGMLRDANVPDLIFPGDRVVLPPP